MTPESLAPVVAAGGASWRNALRGGFILAGLYCILYSPVLAFSKTGLVRPLVIVGLLGALVSAARAGVLDVRIPRAVVIVAAGLFFALAFGQMLAFLGGADLYLRTLVMAVFTGILPLTYLVVWAVPSDRHALPYIAAATAVLGSIQSGLILADWLFAPARALFGALVMQPEAIDEGIRAAGLTSMTGDGLSVSQAICAVCAMYLAVNADRRLVMAGWAAGLFAILATMMFVGRTGFVLIAVFAVFIAVFHPRRMRVISGTAILLGTLAAGVWYITQSIDDARLSALFSRVVSHAFEAVIGLGEGGGVRTSSTDDLISMIVFPDSLKGWLIGYGFYENPASPDENYMGTDIGYLRLLFYVGMIGSALIYLWYLWAGSVAFRTLHRAQERMLCAGLIACFFVSQLKFSFLLLLAPMGYTLILFFSAVQDRFRCA